MGREIRTPATRGSEHTIPHAGFAAVVESRAEPMIRALSEPASALLLVGEPGSGKAYMAEHVARSLEAAAPGAVRTFVLPRPPDEMGDPESLFGAVFPEVVPSRGGARSADWVSETFRTVRVAERILEVAQEAAGRAEPLLVLPGVDHYSALAAAVLEHLVRLRGARIIGTAQRMRGGANQLARDPRTVRITVAPLDLDEADELLSSLLGTARLAPATLRRWHAATGGNSHALSLMLVANERSGAMRHRQGMAQVPLALEEIPEEFVEYLDETCTPEERETLDMLALADPMFESPLLRLLDPRATDALIDRGLISSQAILNGRPALRINRSILSSAIRSRMSPLRRIALSDAMFLALTEGDAQEDFAYTSPHLLRAVEFGLESGRTLPHDWLAVAVTRLFADADPALMLRVSLALARGYDSADAAAAALRSVSYAVQLGDSAAAETAYGRIDELLMDRGAIDALPSALSTRLRLAKLERRFVRGAAREDVLASLDALEAALGGDDTVPREAVRGMRFRLLLRDGDFVGAAEVQPPLSSAGEDLVIEWVRAPSRSASALLLQQQGHLEESIQLAYRARSIAAVGRRPLNDIAELQGFHWFLGYWASGSAEGARRALVEIEEQANASRNTGAWLSDLIEAGWALLALQEARWRDAADLVELVIDCAQPDDPYGTLPLLNAVLALALAALGERDEAISVLSRAREERRGLSQSISGFRRRLIVQVQQWLQHGDPGAEALELAGWARANGLPLIELEALHIAAVESRTLAREVRPRARELAAGIDPLISEAISAHIEKIADGASPTDVSEPEVRLLAELGLWIPLPKSSALSAREREVALLAALGYSSRSIAGRFHLSIRTVETHLAHVYAKLGLADRDELRSWFSADRRVS